jgi:hypothetical protein
MHGRWKQREYAWTLGRLKEKYANQYLPAAGFNLVREQARKKLRNEGRTVCENTVCTYRNHVQACHRVPITDFPLTATIAVVNASDNLLALCPNCHWDFDHGYLKMPPAGNDPATSRLKVEPSAD